MNPNSSAILEVLISNLENANSSIVYDSLVKIRTSFSKNEKDLSKFRKLNGLVKLFTIINSNVSKYMNVSLSILGNCCIEDKSRLKILQLGHVKTCCDLLKNAKTESEKNRASRIIGNLAQTTPCCLKIHEDSETPKHIILYLEQSEDVNSCQTHARTIRLLSEPSQNMQKMLKYGCLKAICKLLKFHDVNVLKSGLKNILFYINKCSEDTMDQLISADALILLVEIAKSDLIEYSKMATNLLCKIARIDMLRPFLGNSGVIGFFILSVPLSHSINRKIMLLNTLCLCSLNSINRNKIRDLKGIHLIFDALNENAFQVLHDRLLSALVCFIYDDSSLNLMKNDYYISTLAVHLNKKEQIDQCIDNNSKNNIESFLQNIKEDIGFSGIKEDSLIMSKTICNNEALDLSRYKPAKEISNKLELNNLDDYNEEIERITSQEISNEDISEKKNYSYSIHSPTYQKLFVSSNNITTDEWFPTNKWQTPNFHKNSEFVSPLQTPENSPFHLSSCSSPISHSYSPLYDRSIDIHNNWSSNESLQELENKYSLIFKEIENLDSNDALSKECSELNEEIITNDNWNDSSYNEANLTNEHKNDNISSHHIDSDEDEELIYFIKKLSDERKFDQILSNFQLKSENDLLEMSSNYLKDYKDKQDIKSLKRSKKNINNNPEDHQGSKKNNYIIKSIENDKLNKEQFLNTSQSNILTILTRLACSSNPCILIKNNDLIKEILHYVKFTSYPIARAGRIIDILFQNPLCFELNILKYIPTYIDIYLNGEDNLINKNENMNTCKQKINASDPYKFPKLLFKKLFSSLSLIATSKYGESIINHHLRTNNCHQSSIAICYLVRSEYMKKKFIANNAFEIIFSQLWSSNISMKKILFKAFTFFLSKLSICSCNNSNNIEQIVKKNLYPSDYDLSIILDDGEILKTSKNMLSNASNVFEVMLGGNFSESKCSIIKINEFDRESVEAFLDTISVENDHKNQVLQNFSGSIVLDILELSHKYMVKNMEIIAIQQICFRLPNILEDLLESPVLMFSKTIIIFSLIYIAKSNSSFDTKFEQFNTITNIWKSSELYPNFKSIILEEICCHKLK